MLSLTKQHTFLKYFNFVRVILSSYHVALCTINFHFISFLFFCCFALHCFCKLPWQKCIVCIRNIVMKHDILPKTVLFIYHWLQKMKYLQNYKNNIKTNEKKQRFFLLSFSLTGYSKAKSSLHGNFVFSQNTCEMCSLSKWISRFKILLIILLLIWRLSVIHLAVWIL